MHSFAVFLDGEPLRYCIRVDTERGEALVVARDETGRLRTTKDYDNQPMALHEMRLGKVEVFWTGELTSRTRYGYGPELPLLSSRPDLEAQHFAALSLKEPYER